MGATVGLPVEPDDVHHAHPGNRGGDEVDLGADQRRVDVCRGAVEKAHLDGAIGGQLGVDRVGQLVAKTIGQRTELEVHARRQRFHVASRGRHLPAVPDDAAHDVQHGVGAHQRVSPVPVERARHGRADGRHRWAIDAPGLLLLTSRLQGVPHERPVLADVGDRIGGTIGREDPGVVGLTTTGGVEHSAVECHAVVVDRNHLRIHRALIGVAQVQLIGCDGVLV